MLTVVCWKWGRLFSALYVNRLASMLRRHLHLPHRLLCVTDDPVGIDRDVQCVALPMEFAGAIRCRRRMWQYSRDRLALFGERALSIDLDMVIVDDITPLVRRTEPVVMWKVGYAGVYSGSFVLFDVGALHGAYQQFRDTPDEFLAATGERTASDQAMLNLWLRGRQVAEWTERDGFVPWFGGERYAHLQAYGMGPDRPQLPKGARIVVMGSADKSLMDEGRYSWVRESWR